MTTLKIWFNTLKTFFQSQFNSNLVYDNQTFQLKENAIILEEELEIQLPKRLRGKTIKQVELIPKFKYFEVIFTYQQTVLNHSERKANEKVMSIDLGLEHLATSTNKMMWFLFMNKAATPRLL
jgi:putative transposase